MTGKMIAFVAALATVISCVVGGVIAIETRYAHCQDLQKTDKRLDLKIRGDKLDTLQKRYWAFEDRYGKEPADPLIKQDMREQQATIQREQKEIEQYGVSK